MKMKINLFSVKSLFVFVSLFFSAVAGFAQNAVDIDEGVPKDELIIVDMKLDPKALYARTNPVEDLNGNPCALILVQVSGVSEMVFPDAVQASDYKLTQYQVFVPAGTKRLKFLHPKYLPGTVVFSDYGISSVEGKSTYILTLRPPEDSKKKKGSAFKRIFGG